MERLNKYQYNTLLSNSITLKYRKANINIKSSSLLKKTTATTKGREVELMYYRKNEQRNQIRDCTLSM